MKKPTKKTYDSATMNPTQDPVVETVEPIVIEISDPVPSIATITQESEPFVKKGGSKRVKKITIYQMGSYFT